MALADSGYKPESEEQQYRTGVLIGAGIGGLQGIEDGAFTVRDRGPRRLSPFFIPGALINLAGGQVSIKHGLKGPNHAVVTACSTGAHAIGDAARLIMLDDADVMVAGGTESAICRLGIAGFAACRALSTGFNDTPEKGSRLMTKTVTALLWAKARVSSFSKNMNTPKRVAQNLCRSCRLWLVGRCVSHHITCRRRFGRVSLHASGVETQRPVAGRYRLCQRAWHINAARR